ncbi:MAG: DUF2071 domain-containing protein [Ardenticatenia bacterium]|nr:MAG: DUF2071 domain-containing protein [Ardenticatenia bacterium]
MMQLPLTMYQEWHQLLFAHWPVPPEMLRPHIPAALRLETFDGVAWIGVVPFHMRNIHLRGGIPLIGAHAFAELNVRTYVRHGDHAGVWFFSLDAASRLAVWGARRFFHLPYFYADMHTHREGETVVYRSQRRDARGHPARFVATYAPSGAPFQATPGTLEHFLTERYCLFAADNHGRLYRGDIRHTPWPLQPATATISENSMWLPEWQRPTQAPLLHYAEQLHVEILPLVRIS